MMWTQRNRRWTKPAAGIVAWIVSLSQLAPIAEASQYLRGAASDRAAGVEARIAGDLARLGGADFAALLGPANLRVLADDALASAGVFPLVGPSARPVDTLVQEYAASYARRYGLPLSPAEQSALRRRLDRVQQAIAQASEGATVSFTVLLDETGRLDLRSDGPDRQALLALGAGTAHVGLGDIEALALGVTDAPTPAEQQLYRRALGMLLRHRAAEAAQGGFLQDAQDNRSFLSRVLEGASALPAVREAQEADHEWRARLRQVREFTAHHRAEALKHQPISFVLEKVGEDRLNTVRGALRTQVLSGEFSSASVTVRGGTLVVTAEPKTLGRDEAQARLIRVIHDALSAFPSGYRGAPGGQWVGEPSAGSGEEESRPSSRLMEEKEREFLSVFSGVVADGRTTAAFEPREGSRFVPVTLAGPSAGRAADAAWQLLGIRSTPVSESSAGPTAILYPEAPLAEKMRAVMAQSGVRELPGLELIRQAGPLPYTTPRDTAREAILPLVREDAHAAAETVIGRVAGGELSIGAGTEQIKPLLSNARSIGDPFRVEAALRTLSDSRLRNESQPPAEAAPEAPMPPLVWADSPDALRIGELGGKVSNSAKMLQAGLDVPNFFAMTNTALQQFHAANPGILERARELVLGVDADDEVSAGDVERQIKGAIANGTIPAELQEQLEASFRELARREGYGDEEIEQFLVAIRSSARMEDLPGVPAAGIQDSNTNVALQTLFENVLDIWGSLFNRRAIAYRDKTAFFMWLKRIDRRRLDLVADLLERALDHGPDRVAQETMAIPGRSLPIPRERLISRLRRIASAEDAGKLKLDEVYLSTKQLLTIFQRITDFAAMDPEAQRLAAGTLNTLEAALRTEIDQFVDPRNVGMSALVQVMRPSEVSIVSFSVNKPSGWTGMVNGLDVVVFEASYGLGEYVVEGKVNPDMFIVARRTGPDGRAEYVILDKMLGTKEKKLIRDPETGKEIEVPVPPEERNRFTLTDEQVLEAARKTFEARRVLNQGREGQHREEPVDTEAVWYRNKAGTLTYNIVQMRDVQLFRGFDFQSPELMQIVRNVIPSEVKRRAIQDGLSVAKGFPTSGAAVGTTVWVEDVKVEDVREALERIAGGTAGAEAIRDVVPAEHPDLFADGELAEMVSRARTEHRFATSGAMEWGEGLTLDQVRTLREASQSADGASAEAQVAEERLQRIVRSLYEAAPGDAGLRDRLLLTLYRAVVEGKALGGELLHEQAAGLAALILNKQFAKVQKLVDAGQDVILFAPETNPNYNEMMAKVKGTLTLQGGETSHAIVIAGQWGYSVVGGANFDEAALRRMPDLIERLRRGAEVTIDANDGSVFLGRLPLEEESLTYPVTRWAEYGGKVGLIAAAPVELERATKLAQYPGHYGVNLTRVEDWLIAEIGTNFRAARAYDRLNAMKAGTLQDEELSPQQLADVRKMEGSPDEQAKIAAKIIGYPSAEAFVRFKLRSLILREMATLTPKQVVQVRAMDFKKNESRDRQAGARLYFNEEPASMIGDRGTGLEVRDENLEGLDLQLLAISDAKQDAQRLGGLGKVGFMLVFIRRTKDLQAALDRMEELYRDGAIVLPDEVGVMFELTINAVLADRFAKILADWRDHMKQAYGADLVTYFSHGTNDQTQSVLGDRDERRYQRTQVYLPGASEPVDVRVFDEGDPAVIANVLHGTAAAKRNGIKCGLCGQAMVNLVNRGTPEALAAAAKIAVHLDSVGTDVKTYGRTVKLRAEAQLAAQSVEDPVAARAEVLLGGTSVGTGAATRRVVIATSPADLSYQAGERTVSRVVEGDILALTPETVGGDAAAQAAVVAAIDRASGVIFSGAHVQDGIVSAALERRKPTIVTASPIYREPEGGSASLRLGALRDGERYTVDFARGQVYSAATPVAAAPMVDDTAYERIDWNAAPEPLPAVRVGMDDVYQALGIHPLALMTYAFLKHEISDPVSRGKIEKLLSEQEISGEAQQRVVEKVGALLERRGVRSVSGLLERTLRQLLLEKAQSLPDGAALIVETSQADANAFRRLDEGGTFELATANAPIAFRGLLKTISPGYDEVFLMFLSGFRNLFFTDSDLRRRDLRLQLDYVQTPKVLELALAFLRARGLVPGEHRLEVGMNIATSANFINAEEFLRQGIRFMAIDPRLLLMNLALADPDNEVLLYDGSMQPLVDPQEPEFQEALGIASQMAKTAAAKHGVKLVTDPRFRTDPVFTITVGESTAVEHALLGFVPAPLEGLSYSEQVLQVWPGYELQVRRGDAVVASYTGAIRQAQNLQPGDTLVLQPPAAPVARAAAELPDLAALRAPVRERPPVPFERRVQLGGKGYTVSYAAAAPQTAEQVAALILNNEKRFAQGWEVGAFEERLIAQGRENPAWFISYIRRVLAENPYSLIARDAQGGVQGIVFVSLSDAKSAEQLPSRHARMRHAHQADGMRSSLTYFWLAPAVPGMADELFLSTRRLVDHLNQAQPETCRIEHFFAYSAPRAYKEISEAHMMWGGPLSIDAYLAFGDDPIVHKFHGRHGGRVVRVIPRAWSQRHSSLGYAVVIEHPLTSEAPKAPAPTPSAADRISGKSRWIFTLFGHNDGVLAPDVIQAFAGRGLFGEAADDYGPFGVSGAFRQPTFGEIADRLAIPEANRGNAMVSLLGLVDLQWLTFTPSDDLDDQHGRYALTTLGLAAVDLLKRSGAYRDTAAASRHLVNLHHYLYGSPLPMIIGGEEAAAHQRDLAVTPGSREAALEAYRALIARARAGWGLPQDGVLDTAQRRAAAQIRTHLDGALLVSTLIALWRPDARPQAAGVLEEFVEPSTGRSDRSIRLQLLNRGSVSLEQLAQAHDREFLEAAFQLFEHQGYVTRQGDQVTLTPAGRFFFDKAGRFGVTHSYLKSYAATSELYWGNPDPWGIEEDAQLDREEDVEASRQTHPTYVPAVHRHIKAAFDRPLNAQQAGLMVLGIGAGSLAASDILYIVNETERGKHLATHPLYFVGVDLSLTSLKLAEQTLRRELAVLESQGIRVVFGEPGAEAVGPDGVPTVYVVLQRGDINLPGRVDADLRARRISHGTGWELAVADLIPLHEFGPHDRGVAVHVQTREQALDVIRAGVARANRADLVAVLEELRKLGALGLVSEIPEEIPEDEEALAQLVARQFTTPFSQKGRLVPAVVGGADLIEYFRGWRDVTDYFMALDLHRRRPRAMEEEVSGDPDAVMDYQHSALAAYQWSQGLTQTMMPYLEHKLAAVLGGWSMREPILKPNDDFAIVSMASYVAADAPAAGRADEAPRVGELEPVIEIPIGHEQTVGGALRAWFDAVTIIPGAPLTVVLDHGGRPVSYTVELVTEDGPFPLGTPSIPVEIGDVLKLTRVGSEEPAAIRGSDDGQSARLDPELPLSEVPTALLDTVAKNALQHAGLRTLGDLRDKSITDLYAITNIGRERLSGIARLRIGIGAAPWTVGASRPSLVSPDAWRDVSAAEARALADAELPPEAGVATLDDVDVSGRTVLVRPDLNVPAEGGRIKDLEHPHARMAASAETIRELAAKGAKVVVIFHQGRPGDPDFIGTPEQHAAQLSRLVERPVQVVDDLFGAAAQDAIKALKPGEILMLKPVRAADPSGGTLEANPDFVRTLTPLVEVFVLDGFSVAHRDSSSVTGFTGVTAVAGRLMQRELDGASKLQDPPQPHLVVVGGGKVSEKLTEFVTALESGKAAQVIVGGRLANLALIAAQPGAADAQTSDAQYELAVATVGRATADDLREFLSHLPQLAGLLAQHRDRVALPVDMVTLRDGAPQVVALADGRVPEGFDGLLSGIGPETARRYAAIAGRREQPFQSAFVLGPLGDTRYEALLPETRLVLEAVAGLPFWSTGGGDTEALVNTLGFTPTYTSLAGGALAEYRSGKTLPGVQFLADHRLQEALPATSVAANSGTDEPAQEPLSLEVSRGIETAVPRIAELGLSADQSRALLERAYREAMTPAVLLAEASRIARDTAAAPMAQQVFAIWRRSYDLPPPPDAAGMSESLQRVREERVRPAYDEVLRPLLNEGRRVLVSLHGNSGRALSMELFGITPEEVQDFTFPLGTPVRIHLDTDGRVLGVSVIQAGARSRDQKNVDALVALLAKKGIPHVVTVVQDGHISNRLDLGEAAASVGSELVLVRHGETESSDTQPGGGFFAGWMDVSLTPQGRSDAFASGQALALVLGEEDDRIDAVFSSDLKRSKDTLSEVLAGLGRPDLVPVVEPRLKERHYGALAGKARGAFMDELAAAIRRLWEQDPALLTGDARTVAIALSARWQQLTSAGDAPPVSAKRAGDPDVTPEEARWLNEQLPAWQPTTISQEERQAMAQELQVFLGADTVVMDAQTRERHQWLIRALRDGAAPEVTVRGVTHKNVAVQVKTVQPGNPGDPAVELDRIPRDPQTLRLEIAAMRLKRNAARPNQDRHPDSATLKELLAGERRTVSAYTTYEYAKNGRDLQSITIHLPRALYARDYSGAIDRRIHTAVLQDVIHELAESLLGVPHWVAAAKYEPVYGLTPSGTTHRQLRDLLYAALYFDQRYLEQIAADEPYPYDAAKDAGSTDGTYEAASWRAGALRGEAQALLRELDSSVMALYESWGDQASHADALRSSLQRMADQLDDDDDDLDDLFSVPTNQPVVYQEAVFAQDLADAGYILGAGAEAKYVRATPELLALASFPEPSAGVAVVRGKSGTTYRVSFEQLGEGPEIGRITDTASGRSEFYTFGVFQRGDAPQAPSAVEPEEITAELLGRVRGEFSEMPDIRVTAAQTARLFGLSQDTAERATDRLVAEGFLVRGADGVFRRSPSTAGRQRPVQPAELTRLLEQWAKPGVRSATFEQIPSEEWVEAHPPHGAQAVAAYIPRQERGKAAPSQLIVQASETATRSDLLRALRTALTAAQISELLALPGAQGVFGDIGGSPVAEPEVAGPAAAPTAAPEDRPRFSNPGPAASVFRFWAASSKPAGVEAVVREYLSGKFPDRLAGAAFSSQEGAAFVTVTLRDGPTVTYAILALTSWTDPAAMVPLDLDDELRQGVSVALVPVVSAVAPLLEEPRDTAAASEEARGPVSLLEQMDALGVSPDDHALRQVAMLPQVPEMARVTDVSDALLTASARVEQTQWIVLDASILRTMSAPIVLERLQALSRATLPGGQSAFRFAFVFRDAETQAQAEQLAEAYFAAMPEASRNTVGLQRADYLILPGARDVDATLRTLELVHPVRGVLGPADWAQAMRQNSAAPGQVRAVALPDAPSGKTPATGQALLDLMEGVAADATQRPLDPAVARRLQAIEGEMPWAQIQDVAAETEQDVRAYEARMESIHAVAIKG